MTLQKEREGREGVVDPVLQGREGVVDPLLPSLPALLQGSQL
jgi:hypothetical protein